MGWKKRGAAEFFQPTSSCLDTRWNTLSSFWYDISNHSLVPRRSPSGHSTRLGGKCRDVTEWGTRLLKPFMILGEIRGKGSQNFMLIKIRCPNHRHGSDFLSIHELLMSLRRPLSNVSHLTGLCMCGCDVNRVITHGRCSFGKIWPYTCKSMLRT